MRSNMKKIIKWVLLIAWMIVIFMFSSQPAEVSDEKSRLVIQIFNAIGLNLDSVLGELANFVVRKAAHFTEYFILALLIFNVIGEEFKLKQALLLSIVVVFLYACSDEFHQVFVPGREGKLRDVLIDTSGGAVAMGVVYIWKQIKN
jgi:VanZ family protein